MKNIVERNTVGMEEKYLKELEILEEVKTFTTLSKTLYATIKQVSDYFEINIEIFQKCIQRNKDELLANELTSLRGKQEIKKLINDKLISKSTTVLTIATPLTVLKFAFLITDSDIALKIREKTLSLNPNLYQKLTNEHRLRFKKYEQKYYDYLSFSFGKDSIQKQVSCGNYKIDFVLFNKIAIEIDENGHMSYNKENERNRQCYILSQGYKMIRYNPQREKPYQLIHKINNCQLI